MSSWSFEKGVCYVNFSNQFDLIPSRLDFLVFNFNLSLILLHEG